MNKKTNEETNLDQRLVWGMELGIDVDKRVLKTAVVVVLEIVVLVLSGFLLVKPRWDELSQLRHDLSVQRAQLRNLGTKLDILERFQLERNGYVRVLTSAFPPSKDVGLVLSSLRSLASDSQIDMVGYKVDPVVIDGEEKKPGGATTTSNPAGSIRAKTESFVMEVTISGKALDIQEFLGKIDGSLPLKVVEDVVITRGGEVRQESSEVLEMRLRIRNFFLPVTQQVNPAGLVRALSVEEGELVEIISAYRGLVVTDEGLVRESIPLGNQNLFGL